MTKILQKIGPGKRMRTELILVASLACFLPLFLLLCNACSSKNIVSLPASEQIADAQTVDVQVADAQIVETPIPVEENHADKKNPSDIQTRQIAHNLQWNVPAINIAVDANGTDSVLQWDVPENTSYLERLIRSENHFGNLEKGKHKDCSLAQLEKLVDTSKDVSAETAVLEELISRLEHEKGISGLQIIGFARTGYTNEELTNGDRREYYPTQVSAGITYPLFGKLTEQRNSLFELETDIKNEKHIIAMKRSNAIENLRQHYILLWGSEQKVALANAFFNQQDVYEHTLEHRLSTGHLLKADYLEFIAMFDVVARDRAISLAACQRARDIIHSLTGVRPGVPLQSAPDLPVHTEDTAAAVASVACDPEILMLQNQIESQLKVLKNSSGIDIKGNISARGFVGSSEDVNTDIGYGALVSLDLVMPSNPFHADKTNRLYELRKLSRLQSQLKSRTRALKLEIASRLRTIFADRQNRVFALTRLETSAEHLRERTARIGRIDGDVLERVIRARHDYYRCAYDLIDLEVVMMQHISRLLQLTPEKEEETRRFSSQLSVIGPLNEDTSAPIKNSAPASDPPVVQVGEGKIGVYIWKSRPVLNGTIPLEQFKEKGISHLLLSFDREQLDSLSIPERAAHVLQFLRACAENNLKAFMLLGEPTWILPESRGDLMSILSLTNRFPFDGVHLDLEPCQLDVEHYGLEYLSSQLLKTVQMAADTCEHPLELSLHPRMFDREETRICFGCALANIHIDKAVMMIYRTDSQQVLQRINTIAAQYPRIRFGLAASVEKDMGKTVSFADLGLETLNDALQQYTAREPASRWHGDVYIQDWASLQEMNETP